MKPKRQESRPFGERIRRERHRLGLNQTQFGALGGVSKATQVAYEADASTPDAGYLARLAEEGVDVFWVFTGHQPPAGVQWELLFEIRDLVSEWARDRGKTTSQEEQDGLLRTLYGQFSAQRRIDPVEAKATFKLVK